MFPYITLLLTRGLDFAQAQETGANCSSDFEWATNSKLQSPCQTAAFLGGACLNSTYSVPAITAGRIYLQPNGPQANVCECNTVFYSLISACSQCQGATPISFGQWKSNCPESATAYNTFPIPVPNDTSIPSWAYLSLKDDESWDYFASAENATNGAWTPPQSGPSLSIPVIIGISLGATAFATLIIFLLLLWCGQRRNRDGVTFILYDRIGGPPPRKPGGFLLPSKKVTSYRPGLNFDLIKNRTGDLVELTPPSQDQTRAQSSWGSVSSLVGKVWAPSTSSSTTTRHENYPQKQPGPDSTSTLSGIFTRPKEVRSQVVPPDFDISP